VRNIKQAKEVKEYINRYFAEKGIEGSAKIVMVDRDLSIEVRLAKPLSCTWKTEHGGFPLIIKYGDQP
jgi:hypothetical protein